jgi:HSP20 family protein
MRMEDLDVSVLGNQLTIAGERKIGPADAATAWRGVAWLRRERGQGRFARTVALPWEIDADQVQARLHDGVLTVTLPKHESAKPRKIKLLPAP